MPALFIRILIAALVVIALHLVLPAFLHILGVTVSGDLQIIIDVVIALVAVWYVFFGRPISIGP